MSTSVINAQRDSILSYADIEMGIKESKQLTLEATGIWVALVSTVIGAVITFSNLFDLSVISSLFGRRPVMEGTVKWTLAIIGGLAIGAWVQRTVYRTSILRIGSRLRRLEEELVEKEKD